MGESWSDVFWPIWTSYLWPLIVMVFESLVLLVILLIAIAFSKRSTGSLAATAPPVGHTTPAPAAGD